MVVHVVRRREQAVGVCVPALHWRRCQVLLCSMFASGHAAARPRLQPGPAGVGWFGRRVEASSSSASLLRRDCTGKVAAVLLRTSTASQPQNQDQRWRRWRRCIRTPHRPFENKTSQHQPNVCTQQCQLQGSRHPQISCSVKISRLACMSVSIYCAKGCTLFCY